MAARASTAVSFTMNREQVTVTGKCVGAGAANPTGLKGVGIASIVRNTQGNYTITLADKYAALLNFQWTVVDSDGRMYAVTLVSEDVAGDKTINLLFNYGNPAFVLDTEDIPVGVVFMFELTLSNTIAVPNGN